VTIYLHIMDQGGFLAPYSARLKDAGQRAIAVLTQYSDLDAVDVSIQPSDWGPDQPYCQAVATGPNAVQITVERTRIESYDIAKSFFRTLVHELHHCLRWRYVRSWTVTEALILEGLALRADTFASGDTTSHIPKPQDIRNDLEYLALHGSSPITDHRDWLYCGYDGATDLPSRIYTVGDYLMIRALKTLGINPFQAARLSAETLMTAAHAQSDKETQ